MKRLLCLMLMGCSLAWGQTLEIISLRHRSAEALLPQLAPFVEPGGALTGMNDKLFLRASGRNQADIRALVASLDTPLRRLMISVRQDGADAGSDRGAGVTGRVEIGAGGLEQGQRRLLDQGGSVFLQQAQVDPKALRRHRGRRQAGVAAVVTGQIGRQLLPGAAEADFFEVAIQQLRMAEEKAAAQHRLAAEGREWFGRIHRGAVLLQPQPPEPLHHPAHLPPHLHPQAGPSHPQALEAAAAAPLPPARSHLWPGA